MKLFNHIILTIILSTTTLTTAHAVTSTPIKNCTAIGAAGVYHLSQDIIGNANTLIQISTPVGVVLPVCIQIAANNVTLNLNNHTLQGQGTGTAIYATEVNNINIKGGVITNFKGAILLEGVTNSIFSKMLITNNLGWAISVNRDFSNPALIKNTSQYNKFINNTIMKNATHGFTINGGSRNTFSANTIINNQGDGLLLYDGSGNLVVGNSVIGNSLRGITNQFGLDRLDTSDNHIIKGNVVRNNGIFDLDDEKVNCANNVWKYNNFGNKSQNCIH